MKVLASEIKVNMAVSFHHMTITSVLDLSYKRRTITFSNKAISDTDRQWEIRHCASKNDTSA